MKRNVCILLCASLLAACAGATYRPLVDNPGPNYESDLYQCQRYAEGEAGPGTGAAVGALLGALLGAVIGHKSGYQGDFARAGAVGGALGGMQSTDGNQHNVIVNCMRGRGYNVLR
jgi:hypothetical protein